MRFRILFRGWAKLLRENWRDIVPSKWGRTTGITAASLVFSALNAIQKALYRDEIAAATLHLDQPIFIIGHWRSGTTLLHELLCLDEHHAYASTRVCMNPSHFLIVQMLVRNSRVGVASAKRPMDNMRIWPDSPQEDEFALLALGACSPYAHWMFPASLRNHPEHLDLISLPPEELAQWKTIFLSFLAQVSVGNPGRLVLKSPTHTFRVNLLREMFPASKFVHIVRDPYTLFLSTRHLLMKMFELYALTRYDACELEDYIFRNGARMESLLQSAIPALNPDRYCFVRYEDLTASPIQQMTRIYERLQLGRVQPVLQKVGAYFDENRNYEPNKFTLTPRERTMVSERWGSMFLRYGYDPSASALYGTF